MYESLNETFKRLKDIFNIEIEPTHQNLLKLQEKKINLNGLEKDVQKVLNPHLLNYLDTWDKIDLMLDDIYNNLPIIMMLMNI